MIGTLVIAANLEDLITLGIFLIFVVGGWIASALKKAEETRQARRAAERQSEGAAPLRRTGERTRLDEVVERRRRQLEEIAARRRGRTRPEGDGVAARSGAAGPTMEPGNLTAAERAARERAKQQYQARAEMLRRQREAAEREAAQRIEREQRQRERAAELARQAEEVKRQRELARQQRARQGQRSTRPISRRGNVATVRPAGASTEGGISGTRAPVEAAAISAPGGTTAKSAHAATKPIRLAGMRLGRQALRQALVMKEILDPPVALRDPYQEPWSR